MTLIEITLIISVLLGLITIVFLGVTSFNKGSSRAKCILQQAQLQKMAISYANFNSLGEGDSVAGMIAILVNDQYVKETPDCPDTGDYVFLDHVPALTESFVTCSITNHISN
ncbi:MAG: hypothetical protein QM496_20295 [Verrucomicrobiota bacterium]